MESKVTDWKIDSIKILAQNAVIPFLKSHKVKMIFVVFVDVILMKIV